MEYLNLHLNTLLTPEYVGSEPVQRATWLSLVVWCCRVENRGVVKDCREWGNRRWMQTCGVTLDEVNDSGKLYWFEGDDLHVYGYPHDAHDILEMKREIARENGRKGGRSGGRGADASVPASVALPEPMLDTTLEPTSHPMQEPTFVPVGTDVGSNAGTDVGKRKEKERKGMERKGEGEGSSTVDTGPAGGDPLPLPDSPAPSARNLAPEERQRRMKFKTLVCGVRDEWPGMLTATEADLMAEAYRSEAEAWTGRTTELVRDYLASPPANASKWDYPADRELYLRKLPVIRQKAEQWSKRTRWKPRVQREAETAARKDAEAAKEAPEEPSAEEAISFINEMRASCGRPLLTEAEELEVRLNHQST